MGVAIGLVLFAPVGSAAFLPPSGYEEPLVQTEQPQQDKPSAYTPNLTARQQALTRQHVARPTNPQQPPAGGQQNSFFWDSAAQWLMAVITIPTLGLILWTLLVTKEMLSEARKGSVAALRGVQATETFGRLQLRPYVTIEPTGIRFIAPPEAFDPTEFLTIRVFLEIANMGTTPAYNLRVSGGFRVVNFDEEDINAFALPERGEPSASLALVPKRSVDSYNLEKPLRITECIRINRGAVLIHAMVTYEADGLCYFSKFSGTTTGFTEAAKQAAELVQKGAGDTQLPKVGFALLHYGNDAT